MSDAEILDLVDENDEVIGTVTREVAHSDPKYIHRGIGLFMYNSKNETLLFKRTKGLTEEGLWVCVLTGHVISGEDPRDAAIREAKEELGIEIKELKFIDKLTDRSHNETMIYHEFYTIHDDSNFKVSEDENDEVKWVKLMDLAEFYENNPVEKISYKMNLLIASKLGLIKSPL